MNAHLPPPSLTATSASGTSVLWPLRAKMALFSGVFLLVCGALLAVSLPAWLARFEEMRELSHVQSTTAVLALASASPVDFQDELQQRELLQALQNDDSAVRARVVLADGSALAKWSRDNQHSAWGVRQTGDLLVQENTISVWRDVRGSTGRKAFVEIEFSRDRFWESQQQTRLATLTLFALFLLLGVLLSWALGRYLSRPATDLAAATERVIAEGLLQMPAVEHSQDEMGVVAERFRALLGNHSATLGDLASVSRHLEAAFGQLGSVTKDMKLAAERSNEQSTSALRVASRTDSAAVQAGDASLKFRDSVKSANDAVVLVNASVDANAKDASTIREVATTTHAEMESVASVAEQAEASSTTVSNFARHTAASLERVHERLGQISLTLASAQGVSAQVSAEATHGRELVQRTLSALRSIHEASNVATYASDQLVERVNQIGDVVSIIDEISAQTNLLSLNASILASSAGEHGRPFAVVAAEMKALSQRTAQHTQSIVELMAAIRSEAGASARATRDGFSRAQQEVEHHMETEAVFAAIVQRILQMQTVISSAADSASEQMRATEQLRRSLSLLGEHQTAMDNLQMTMRRAIDTVRTGSSAVMDLTQKMDESAHDTQKITGRIVDALKVVEAASLSLSMAQEQHQMTSEQLVVAVHALAAHAHSQAAHLPLLGEIGQRLHTDAERMAVHFRRYKL